MKTLLSKITSFTLAFLVLFSTFSFTVESHYCGDFLIDVSYIGNAEVCKGDITEDSSIKMKDCCSDEIQKIEGQDELQQLTFNDLDFSKQWFTVSFLISHKDVFVEKTSKNDTYKDFSPSDIPINYQVLYQSFLI